jgi:hypothetical protein
LLYSILDGKKGFGGVHGVDEHVKDTSAVGIDYKTDVEKHASQIGETSTMINVDDCR